MQLGNIFEKIFLFLKFVLKNRFYFFVVFIISSSYAYRIKKSIILKRLPSFVVTKNNTEAIFFDFDFNTLDILLSSDGHRIRYSPSGILLPSNGEEASKCEKEVFSRAQNRMFEILSKAQKISITSEYSKNNVTFGAIKIDKEELAEILVREHLAHDLTKGNLNSSTSWCQILGSQAGGINKK